MDIEKIDNLINEIIDKISTELKGGYIEDTVELIKALTDLIIARAAIPQTIVNGPVDYIPTDIGKA